MKSSRSAERMVVSGVFGTVTTQRVICQHLKGWLLAGFGNDIALTHITSAHVETSRFWIRGLFLWLVATWGLMYPPPVGTRHAVGVLCLVFGTLLIWGSPTVWIRTSSDRRSASTGWPWQRRQAEEFVEAVHRQIAMTD